jgi:hypothetical protein
MANRRETGSVVVFGRCGPIGRVVAALVIALALSGVAPQPASAQNLIEALFGGFYPPRSLPPRASAYSDPFFGDDRMQRRAPAVSYADYGGPARGFCVRTCDGFHFAVRASGGMSAAEMCRSFCPAARTQVFSGSRIEHSVGPGGQRYASLDTAFLYRERRVDNCTCNGRHAFGLVPLKPEADPTLRPGDVIATNDGLVTYTGTRRDRTAEFTPIEKAGGPSEWRLRLMSIKVAPAPEQTATVAAPPEEPKKPERRRAQRPAIYR